MHVKISLKSTLWPEKEPILIHPCIPPAHRLPRMPCVYIKQHWVKEGWRAAGHSHRQEPDTHTHTERERDRSVERKCSEWMRLALMCVCVCVCELSSLRSCCSMRIRVSSVFIQLQCQTGQIHDALSWDTTSLPLRNKHTLMETKACFSIVHTASFT